MRLEDKFYEWYDHQELGTLAFVFLMAIILLYAAGSALIWLAFYS